MMNLPCKYLPAVLLLLLSLICPEGAAQGPIQDFEVVKIPEVSLAKAAPEEVLKVLQGALDADRKRRGKYVFRFTKGGAAPKVTVRRNGMTLLEFLDFLDSAYAIRWRHLKPTRIVMLSHRRSELLLRYLPLSELPGENSAWKLKVKLEKQGVVFPEGSELFFDKKSRTAVFRNTWKNLEHTEKILKKELLAEISSIPESSAKMPEDPLISPDPAPVPVSKQKKPSVPASGTKTRSQGLNAMDIQQLLRSGNGGTESSEARKSAEEAAAATAKAEQKEEESRERRMERRRQRALRREKNLEKFYK